MEKRGQTPNVFKKSATTEQLNGTLGRVNWAGA